MTVAGEPWATVKRNRVALPEGWLTQVPTAGGLADGAATAGRGEAAVREAMALPLEVGTRRSSSASRRGRQLSGRPARTPFLGRGTGLPCHSLRNKVII